MCVCVCVYGERGKRAYISVNTAPEEMVILSVWGDGESGGLTPLVSDNAAPVELNLSNRNGRECLLGSIMRWQLC